MPDGVMVIGGYFSEAGGDPNANCVAMWNGTNWQSLGGGGVTAPQGGTAPSIQIVKCLPDSTVIVAGFYGMFNDMYSFNRTAIYRNGSWSTPEFIHDFMSFTIYCILATGVRGYDLYLGGDFEGVMTAPNPKELEYKLTTSSGSANAYPLIEIVGPGKLEAITNHTTGRSIKFNDFTLLDGEKIWIHFDPVKLEMISSWSGRGSVWRYLNAGSDIGDWYIKPGINSIGVFISSGYDVNVTKAFIQWYPKFWSLDGAVYE